MLLNLDYRVYSECLAKFFGIEPKSGETIAVDVKYCGVPINWKLITRIPSPSSDYAGERLLGGARFDSGTLWGGCQKMRLQHYRVHQDPRLKGWCLPLMPLVPKKTCQVIIDSGNHYIGALKGNQPGLLEQVQENFIPLERVKDICKRAWSDWKTYIKHLSDAWWYPRMARVEDANSSRPERQTIKAQVIRG